MAKREVPDLVHTRSYLAYFVLGIGIVGITIVSWVAIAFSTDAARPEMTRLVFAAVLPLLGTWVGAVIAFYFGRDNLEVGSQTTLAAVRAAGGLAEYEQVTSVMAPYNRIVRKEVSDDAAAQALGLAEFYQTMLASGLSRVPVFANRRALYIVHEPDLDKYAQKQSVSTALLAAQKLSDLLADADLKKAVSTFAAVPGTATVAEARAALDKVPEAKDLFVTDDGKTTGSVLGWLTSSDLARTT